MRTNEKLIQTIQEFIGPDGYVAFEHGFNPGFNAIGIAYDHVDRKVVFAGEKRELYFEDMSEQQLTAIIIDLMRYLNFCHLYA